MLAIPESLSGIWRRECLFFLSFFLFYIFFGRREVVYSLLFFTVLLIQTANMKMKGKKKTNFMHRYDLRDAVNASSLESWDDEFPIANVTKAPSRIVKPPRVAESPVSFECKVHSIVRVHGDTLVGHSDIVIGRVVGIHVRGEYVTPDGVSHRNGQQTHYLLRTSTLLIMGMIAF
jgi:hypothetical protein